MKRITSLLAALPKIPKKLLAIVAVGLVISMPVITVAAEDVKLEGSVGAANVTTGDTAYSQAVNAKYNEVVKIQVYYNNTQAADSGKNAQNVKLKVDIPSAAGKSQVVKGSIKGDNTNAVTGQSTIILERDDASLQYIPGSAVWKHNTGTNDKVNYVEEKVADEVVVGAQGLNAGTQQPGINFSSSVTVLARVMVPGVKITKQVELQSESNKWAASNTAKPGDTLKYLISYQNTGNTDQNKVVVHDTLPAHVSLMPGTVKLTNTNSPNGVAVADDVAKGGLDIGTYGPGANAYVSFEAKIDTADKLACGSNDLRNIGAVQPESMNEYYATAVTTVARDCSTTPTPTPTPAPSTKPSPTPAPTAPVAAYSCDALTITKGDGRKITVKVDYTAKNGASLKTVSYNFGDNSQALSTDKTSADYTYPKDGTYTVTATLLLSVNGKDQTSTSAACAKQVTVGPVATPTAPTSAAGALPNTGPGDVFGWFVAATVAGTLFHRLFLSRRVDAVNRFKR